MNCLVLTLGVSNSFNENGGKLFVVQQWSSLDQNVPALKCISPFLPTYLNTIAVYSSRTTLGVSVFE